MTKEQCYNFESGSDGLSARMLRKDLELLIVDKNGAAHSYRDWPRAGVFRSLGQENLLVSDNQTRVYEKASAKSRFYWELLTWGSAMPEDLPSDFPTLGFDFSVGWVPKVRRR